MKQQSHHYQSSSKHDNDNGPCACGAWHDPIDDLLLAITKKAVAYLDCSIEGMIPSEREQVEGRHLINLLRKYAKRKDDY